MKKHNIDNPKDIVNAQILGPYFWLDNTRIPYLFTEDMGNSKGVYLWAVPYKNAELVYYVGETGRSFSERMFEHYKEYMSGVYGINDPRQLKKGQRDLVWDGLWRKGKDYKSTEFLSRYKELIPKLYNLLKLFRIYLIPLDCDNRLRKRIEGAITNTLYEQNGIIGNFQEVDMRYIKRTKDEEPIKLKLKSKIKILGLPKELIV